MDMMHTPAARSAESPGPAIKGDCLNCGTLLLGAFCHGCGQKASTRRLTLPGLLHEVPHAVLHVDRGILYTLRGLARDPGVTINQYLDGQRARYFNPLTLLILLVGLSTLLYSTFPLPFDPPKSEEAARYDEFVKIVNFKYPSLALALALPLQALLSWLMFLGYGRSFAEHVVINAYLSAFSSLMACAAFPLLKLLGGGMALGLGGAALGIATFVYWLTAMWSVFSADPARTTTLERTLGAAVGYAVVSYALMRATYHFVYLPLQAG